MCRTTGALVIWDLVDYSKGSPPLIWNFADHVLVAWDLWFSALRQSVDAIVCTTEAQALWLARHGVAAVALPHSHGNVGEWSVARSVRPQVRGVAMVYEALQSQPTPEDLRDLTAAVCRMNATLWLIHTSHKWDVQARPCPQGSPLAAEPPPPPPLVPPKWCTSPNSASAAAPSKLLAPSTAARKAAVTRAAEG